MVGAMADVFEPCRAPDAIFYEMRRTGHLGGIDLARLLRHGGQQISRAWRTSA